MHCFASSGMFPSIQRRLTTYLDSLSTGFPPPIFDDGAFVNITDRKRVGNQGGDNLGGLQIRVLVSYTIFAIAQLILTGLFHFHTPQSIPLTSPTTNRIPHGQRGPRRPLSTAATRVKVSREPSRSGYTYQSLPFSPSIPHRSGRIKQTVTQVHQQTFPHRQPPMTTYLDEFVTPTQELGIGNGTCNGEREKAWGQLVDVEVDLLPLGWIERYITSIGYQLERMQ